MIQLPSRATIEQPDKMLAILRKLIGFEADSTIDVASLVDAAGATSSAIAVPGATLGDYVLVAPELDLVGITVTGYVSATDAVKIRVQNESGSTVDLASAVFHIRVIPSR